MTTIPVETFGATKAKPTTTASQDIAGAIRTLEGVKMVSAKTLASVLSDIEDASKKIEASRTLNLFEKIFSVFGTPTRLKLLDNAQNELTNAAELLMSAPAGKFLNKADVNKYITTARDVLDNAYDYVVEANG